MLDGSWVIARLARLRGNGIFIGGVIGGGSWVRSEWVLLRTGKTFEGFNGGGVMTRNSLGRNLVVPRVGMKYSVVWKAAGCRSLLRYTAVISAIPHHSRLLASCRHRTCTVWCDCA